MFLLWYSVHPENRVTGMLNLGSSERMLRKIDLPEKLESRFVEFFLYQLRGKQKKTVNSVVMESVVYYS